MNKLNLLFISFWVFSSDCMEPIKREKAGSQELALSRSTPESSSSDKAVLEDVEIGQEKPSRTKSGSIIVDRNGKRHSVHLALEEIAKNIISAEVDLSDPAITQKAKEALCNQMAKDLLNIVYNPEDNKAHKKYKFVKKSLAKALEEQHDSPRNGNILEEIRRLRKVSVAQISARKSAKIKSKSNPASAVTATRAAANTPSPRDLFLQNSPTQSDQAYAELGKLLQEQLAKEGASQEKQKFWASVVAVGGPLLSAGITALIYKFTGCPTCNNGASTNTTLPL